MHKPSRNSEALYRTVEQIMEDTNLCRDKVMRVAKEADAVIRVDRTVRINADKFFEYLELAYNG